VRSRKHPGPFLPLAKWKETKEAYYAAMLKFPCLLHRRWHVSGAVDGGGSHTLLLTITKEGEKYLDRFKMAVGNGGVSMEIWAGKGWGAVYEPVANCIT
jgi:hypothetical protein